MTTSPWALSRVLRFLAFPLLLSWGMLVGGSTAAQRAAFDVRALSSGLGPVVALARAPLTLNVTFQNPGTNTIWAMDVNYRVDHGPTHTYSHSFPNGSFLITQGGPQTVPHPVAWTPPGVGRYTIRCWASGLNVVNPDGNPANDTVVERVTIVAREATRLPVLEVFTSGSCPICGAGTAALEALENRHVSRVACLHYPQDLPGAGDANRTAETVGRRAYYGIQAVPTVTLDGATPKPAARLTDADILDRQAQPCFLDLDAVFARQATSRTVSVQARLRALGPGASPHLVLRAVVVEPRVVPSLATNGQTYLPHMVRKLLPRSGGVAVGALPSGATRTLSAAWTVPTSLTSCAVGTLEVVVFAQDTVTKEVQQGVRARLNGVLGEAELNPEALVWSVAPNPASASNATLVLTLPAAARVRAQVCDALGRVVCSLLTQSLAAGTQALPLDLGGVGPGLYAVQLTVSGQTHTRRLVVE